MTTEELQYVNSLKKEIERLKKQVKLITKEKDEALTLAWKYLDKFIEDNDLSDEVIEGVRSLFNK